MIYSTFERLPQEKKKRIIAAACKEFLNYPYEKSSINRVLSNAKVPKGSFYQYFDDKEDLLYLCVKTIYQKVIDARSSHHESLLDSGIIRANQLGYDKAKIMFSQDIKNYLSSDDISILENMMNAPDAVRNHIQMRLSSELIVPIIKKELQSHDDIRKDIDYDFYAYIISQAEMLSIDYGKSRGYNIEQMMQLSYTYLKIIYDSINK